MKKLNFQIEVSRILEILSNDIYDSPYALLRENIQNAYDAILMRISEEGSGAFEPKIEVTIHDKMITIWDNGIGMDESVIQNNFWKAGSSGKNTEAAKRAGVIGTFGIGAMANFGVADTLKVTSRKSGSESTIETYAQRENLSVTEECVDFKYLDQSREEPGTTIEARLDANIDINESGAIDYLSPYIQYARIPIFLNAKIVSQKNYINLYESSAESIETSGEIQVDSSNVECTLKYILNKNGNIKLHVSNITFNKTQLGGDMVLVQGLGNIYGLRNYFGLAPLPAPNNFNFGGIVNLNNLHPTAGREALSRESINVVTHILRVLEDTICKEISKFDVVDINTLFLNYIVSHSKYDLAGKIKIDIKPGQEMIRLENIWKKIDGRQVYFYGGRDQKTILSFGNENSYLLNLSQNNPRRKIQYQIVKLKGIDEVPDHPQILNLIDKKDLSLGEVAVMLRVSSILSEDYLLPDNEVQFAEISHQVPSLIKKEQSAIKVFLSRESAAIQNVITAYSKAYEVFEGFVKDFIRNDLYQKFSNYIPSSTRNGAETLYKLLLKNRELFKYESTDLGDLDSLLSEYAAGELELPEVLKKTSQARSIYSQNVGQTQVGNAEEEIPSLIDNVAQEEVNDDYLVPLPPIDRTETKTDKIVLKTAQRYPHLNNYKMFLSLSDRVYRRQADFFFEPHTTKVIWGMHRIVYIFTHASRNLSLYYDIELKERLINETTGGKPILSTTILTKDKIFIPIINEFEEYFDIKEGEKKFFVRHDIITDFSKE